MAPPAALSSAWSGLAAKVVPTIPATAAPMRRVNLFMNVSFDFMRCPAGGIRPGKTGSVILSPGKVEIIAL